GGQWFGRKQCHTGSPPDWHDERLRNRARPARARSRALLEYYSEREHAPGRSAKRQWQILCPARRRRAGRSSGKGNKQQIETEFRTAQLSHIRRPNRGTTASAALY